VIVLILVTASFEFYDSDDHCLTSAVHSVNIAPENLFQLEERPYDKPWLIAHMLASKIHTYTPLNNSSMQHYKAFKWWCVCGL
jgi:hypothetical protein